MTTSCKTSNAGTGVSGSSTYMKTFFQRLWAFISHIFISVFHSAITAFDALPQDEKDALTHAVGFVNIVRNDLEATPAEIVQQIQTAYPNLAIPQIDAALSTILRTFNLSTSVLPLEDGVGLLQGWIKTHTGTALDTVLHTIAVALAAAMSPEGTPLLKITSIIEAVYQALHKS